MEPPRLFGALPPAGLLESRPSEELGDPPAPVLRGSPVVRPSLVAGGLSAVDRASLVSAVVSVVGVVRAAGSGSDPQPAKATATTVTASALNGLVQAPARKLTESRP